MSFWNKNEKPASDPAPRSEPLPPVAPGTAAGAAPGAPAPTPPAPPAVTSPAPAATVPVAPSPSSAPPGESAAVPAPAAGDLRLGRGVRLEGKLTFSGTVRIDASFQGSIVTDGVLVVGSAAKVDAEIACGTVVVEGEVNGDVVASAGVELRPSARLRGDVETPSLVIDRGALFEGASRRARGGGSERRAGKAVAAPAPSAG